ncbi:MAG: hypothetical protein WCA35_14345 [Kovacikia sp.]
MSTFKHHPDGWIYLDELCLPLDFFQQQEPGYALPEGAVSREYSQGRHVLYSADNQWAGDMPWPEGDLYLAGKETYAAAWIATINPPPDLATTRLTKLAELNLICTQTIRSGFGSLALGSLHRYSSELEDQINLLGATALGAALYYVCSDSEGVKMARFHTQAQLLQVYQDGVTMKQQNIYHFHELRLAVESAETISDVNAINW